MKTSYVLAAAILAGTGTGNAQTPTVDCPATTLMPGCAISCITDAAKAVCGEDKEFDFKCQCANAAEVQGKAALCVLGSCGTAAPQVVTAASAICSQCATA